MFGIGSAVHRAGDEGALLALSRELGAARDDGELSGALARALEHLFPGRCFAIRLLDPRTGVASARFVQGRVKPNALARLALRRVAIEKTRLSAARLSARGLEVTTEDAPVFEGCVAAQAIPLAASGELYGILNLDYPPDLAAERAADARVLKQVANHAALALRNLRSMAEAEHAERLAGIGLLVAGVVHELNNPLTAVTMYSEALLEKHTLAGGDPADLEKLRAIRDAGARIGRLARDLVTYARPGGARTEALDLAEVLDEAARLAKPPLKEANAVIERRGGPVPRIEGHRATLVHVFVNLVTNAAQATAPKGGGTIVLGLAASDESVVATVEDAGEGMTAEVRARAFEPFFTTRPGRGIGLGLPIVLGILERHGGSLAMDTTPGVGTKVTVTLPVRHVAAPPAA